MNKTKRTLIVSSIVMALILVVTAVSVTAAWFTNFANSKEDGFTIDSALLQESASIDIDSTASDYGTAIWPAVASRGYESKGNLSPYGTDLKSTENGKIDKKAKCAVLYFPINFVGAPDTHTVDGSQVAIDGRKSLLLSVVSAHIGTKDESGNSQTSDSDKDYLSEFNVEMELVKLVKDEDGNSIGETITSVNPDNFSSDSSAVYYNQPFTDDAQKLPSHKLYMLVKPGEKYYVKATVYFNRVDEDCDENLIYLDEAKKSIVFKFEIKNDIDSNIDIRQGIMPV